MHDSAISSTLFIVGTPIGNLQDMSSRAIGVLNDCDLILAEDTRHSIYLLRHFSIKTPLKSYHEHNERLRVDEIINLLLNSHKKIALISDAGMPMISDPGYILVKAALQHNIKVRVVPGPTALTSAISISGIDCSRFCFEGFLPSKAKARIDYLTALVKKDRIDAMAIVLYEAPHRLLKTIKDIKDIFGAERIVAVIKEITKQYESIYYGTVNDILDKMLKLDSIKGEYVIIISGNNNKNTSDLVLGQEQVHAAIQLFKAENIPMKQAVRIISELYKLKKNYVYDLVLKS